MNNPECSYIWFDGDNMMKYKYIVSIRETKSLSHKRCACILETAKRISNIVITLLTEYAYKVFTKLSFSRRVFAN